MYSGPSSSDPGEGQQQAEDDADHGAAPSASTSRSSSTPREPLTSTRSPAAAGMDRSNAATASSTSRAMSTRARPACARRLGDPAAALPHRQQPVDDVGRPGADLPVQPLLVRAQLQHVAQHRVAPPPGGDRRLAQEVERRRDRDRRRVVGVVDQRRAGGGVRDRHAMVGVAAGRQRGLDLVERHVEALGDRRGGQGVRHQVAAGHGAAHAARSPRRLQREDRAAQAQRLDLRRRGRRRPAEPVGSHLGRRSTAAMAATRRSSAFRTARPSARQGGGQLRLGAGDGLDAAGPLQVRGMHRQHHAHLGARDLGQAGDLALGVHAHLEHRHLVRRLEAQQGHGQAGLGVQVALVAQHRARARQHVGHDLLGDRLAGRAGDPGHAHRRTAAPPGGELLQRGERVGTWTSASSCPAGASTGRSTRATRRAVARRPRPRSAWPSTRSPRSATNRLPGVTCRESTAAVVKEVTVVGPRRRPPVAASEVIEADRWWHSASCGWLADSSSLIGWRPAGRAVRRDGQVAQDVGRQVAEQVVGPLRHLVQAPGRRAGGSAAA